VHWNNSESKSIPGQREAFLLVKTCAGEDLRRVFAGLPPPRFFWIVACVLLFGSTPLRAWTVTTINDRDYVPFSEIRTFYEFNLAAVTPSTIRYVKPNKVLATQIGSRELYINNLRFYLSLPVVTRNGVTYLSRLDLAKVLDPVLRPAHIRGARIRTVILDPGHGGNDQGTWSYYGSEKAYTLDVANRLAPLLRAQGLKVAFTRTNDTYVSLEDRVQLANKNANALFVSLHFNAGAVTSGVETYALTPRGVSSSDNKPTLHDILHAPGNDRDPENIALATAVHGALMQRVQLPDRGIRRARFHVLRGIEMPGVLIEGGYLAGQDAFIIAHPQFRQDMAESIALGISRYLAAVPDMTAPPPLEKLPFATNWGLPKPPPPANLVQSSNDIPEAN
jgi:N-acetylmuramoyl-L-alanine amidase